MDFLYVACSIIDIYPSLWCGCKPCASCTSFWVGRRKFLKISCLVFGEWRGISLSWRHYPPLLWTPFPNHRRLCWTRQPSTPCCWYLNILCLVWMPWAHYHRTATPIQDKRCDVEQFNQQKAKNKEEDKTETASGACLGNVSLCRTVSGFREAVQAEGRALCCASWASRMEWL